MWAWKDTKIYNCLLYIIFILRCDSTDLFLPHKHVYVSHSWALSSRYFHQCSNLLVLAVGPRSSFHIIYYVRDNVVKHLVPSSVEQVNHLIEDCPSERIQLAFIKRFKDKLQEMKQVATSAFISVNREYLKPLGAKKNSEDTRKKGKGAKTGASHDWWSFYLSQYEWLNGNHMTKVV